MPEPVGKSKSEVLQMSSAVHACSYIAALPSVLTNNVEPVMPVAVLVSTHTYILDGFHCECSESTGRMIPCVISAKEHGIMRSR